MANLHLMLSMSPCPRTSIRMTVSSPPDRKHRNQYEVNLGDKTDERSKLGLYAMNGGDGASSYAQNSSYQRGVVDIAKPIIEEEIAKELDVKQHSLTHKKSFQIADFGCSTGLNSFPAIQIITEAIERKFLTEGSTSPIPDFQVFFNDQLANDFNTLFHSLPPQRNYHAAGIPGSFHGQLFPRASLDFAYSSCTLNWLSGVPTAVSEKTSSAWNNGRVHYTEARHEVYQAYSDHYANDIQSFLEARAQELVGGGLMALLVPADPAFKLSPTSFTTPSEINLLGSCLIDMARKRTVSEERVDSFNFPLYFTLPEELKALIERNHSFTIERMEILNNPGKSTLCSATARSAYLRAVFEGMLTNHFGNAVMDELFDRYRKKLAATPHFLDPDNEKSIMILVILKRTAE